MKTPIVVVLMFISILGIFFCLFVNASSGAEVTLEWTYPDDAKADGFKIFMIGGEVNAYDYAAPIVTVGAADRVAKISVPGVDGKITAYKFVARAFRGDRDSEDSNECKIKIDLAPIAKPEGLKCFIDEVR